MFGSISYAKVLIRIQHQSSTRKMIANNIRKIVIHLLLMGEYKCDVLFVILLLKKNSVCIANNFFRKLFKNTEVFFLKLDFYFTVLIHRYKYSITHAKGNLA